MVADGPFSTVTTKAGCRCRDDHLDVDKTAVNPMQRDESVFCIDRPVRIDLQLEASGFDSYKMGLEAISNVSISMAHEVAFYRQITAQQILVKVSS